jgi:hypothetical protein
VTGTRHLVALLAAAAIATATTQSQVRDAAGLEAPSGTARLSGVVLSVGEPLARATVSIAGDVRLNLATVTDASGRFSFEGLPAGRFTITAAKGGYPPMSYGATRSYRAGSGVLLSDGQAIDDIVLRLARGAVLTGTVFDEQGEPIPGVPVMAYEVRTTLAGERTFDFPPLGGGWVVSDDRGQYRVFGLPPGDYTVGTAWYYSGESSDVRVPTDAEMQQAFRETTPGAAAAPAQPGAPQPASPAGEIERFNFSPVYHPGVVDPLDAAALSVSAGEVREGVDLRMQFRPMSRIEGVIVGLPEGSGARLALFRRSAVQAVNTTSYFGAGTDGTFTTRSLAPSDYTLMASVPATETQPALWASADATVAGSEPVHVTLTLQPTMTMTGRLTFDGTVLDPPDPATVTLSLRSMPGTSAMNRSSRPTIEASGAFEIPELTPGRFLLYPSVRSSAAQGEPAWSVRSVIADGQDVTDLPIAVTAARAPSLVVTFTDAVSELSGVIESPADQTPSNFFVVVVPVNRTYWTQFSRRIASTRPDAAGRYLFRGLPAGEYVLAATTDLVPRDLYDEAALERIVEQSTPLSMSWGEKKSINLRIGG